MSAFDLAKIVKNTLSANGRNTAIKKRTTEVTIAKRAMIAQQFALILHARTNLFLLSVECRSLLFVRNIIKIPVMLKVENGICVRMHP